MASVLSSNAFALLDDDEQGNVATDAAAVANVPAAKAAPAKAKEEPKPGAGPMPAGTPAVPLCCEPLMVRLTAPHIWRLHLLKACRTVAAAKVATGVEARMRGAAPENNSRGGRGRGPGPRSTEGPGRGRGYERPPREEGEAFDAGTGPAASRGRGPARGGPVRGGRAPGGRGGREDGRPPRRMYDRHDGTGRGWGIGMVQCWRHAFCFPTRA